MGNEERRITALQVQKSIGPGFYVRKKWRQKGNLDEFFVMLWYCNKYKFSLQL